MNLDEMIRSSHQTTVFSEKFMFEMNVIFLIEKTFYTQNLKSF
jgi:hypothetical protein